MLLNNGRIKTLKQVFFIHSFFKYKSVWFRDELINEWRQCLALMGPIFIAQIAQMLMTATDTVMAGHISPVDLAAVGVGGGLWVPCLLFSVGVLGALQPLIAHARGEGQFDFFAPLLRRTLIVSCVLGISVILLLNQSTIVLTWLGTEKETLTKASAYLVGLSWGVLPLFLLLVFRNYCEGLGKPVIFTYMYLVIAAINVPLNFIFMYGYFGLPALGGVGCGYASSIANTLGLVFFIVYAWRTGLLSTRNITPQTHLADSERALLITEVSSQSTIKAAPSYGALLRLGLPMGFHLFCEGTTFSGLVLLVAPLGPISVAANQIALSIISLLFMIPLSMGMALCIRVAYLRGLGNFVLARSLSRSTPFAILLVALPASCLLIWQKQLLISFYTSDSAVIELAMHLLFLAAFFQIADMSQVVWTCVLRGMQDTFIPLLIILAGFWCLGIPLGYVLARTDAIVPALGVAGFWLGLLVALICVMAGLWWRLWRVSARAVGNDSAAMEKPALVC